MQSLYLVALGQLLPPSPPGRGVLEAGVAGACRRPSRGEREPQAGDRPGREGTTGRRPSGARGNHRQTRPQEWQEAALSTFTTDSGVTNTQDTP